jgi:4-carboxymuconolactone decarboxylase
MSKKILANAQNGNHLFKILFIVIMITAFSNNSAFAQDTRYIRIAKIAVDSTQMESYKAALKEGIETAVRTEPGVLTLYAVYDKNNPTRVTVFEIYASEEAYKLHIQTAHFKKYKSTVENMVKSLELTDVAPIALETKPK